VDLLRTAFGTQNEVLLLVGSGSAGLDAAIGSLTRAAERVVVGVNGYFGRRIADIARSHGCRVDEVQAEWGSPLDPAAVEASLVGEPVAAAVVVVHVETSTGVVNPVPAIARIAEAHGAAIVVDAISSLGGMEIAMDEWGVDVCVAASQKCLGGPPGLAPVAVADRAWERIARAGARPGWYLDLGTWREFAVSGWSAHPSPVTVPTNAVRALLQGLRELADEGISQRARRFAGLGERLRDGLRSTGTAPLADEADSAPVVTAARSFPGVPSSEIVAHVERAHGIRIAGGGIGPLQDSVFRIGHMASGTSPDDIDDVVAAIGSFPRR
jgi:alanine-glyoxylate transaminase/serine-glyoxylate transaminase/serine-pyruvate transaminase